jgi:hypothetical protein
MGRLIIGGQSEAILLQELLKVDKFRDVPADGLGRLAFREAVEVKSLDQLIEVRYLSHQWFLFCGAAFPSPLHFTPKAKEALLFRRASNYQI